ncbi:hypothetical protein IW261DRAFT_1507176, partial [Armillaria novae-zelandiae]
VGSVRGGWVGDFEGGEDSLDRCGSPASVSTVSADGEGEGTAERARHHPFLSPPASVIFSADEGGPSRFGSLVGEMDSDSGSTVTEVDISAYPLLPDSPSDGSGDMDARLADENDDDFGDGGRASWLTTPPRSRLSSPLLSSDDGDAIPLPDVPAHAYTKHQRDVLPRGMQTIPITVLGGTEPVNIPVRVGDPAGRAPSCSESSVSGVSDIGDVPFPEVERRVPVKEKRSAFPTRSAHTTSIQGKQRVAGSDDTNPSLFTRLAVPPAVAPPKTPSPKTPSRHFEASDLLAGVDPRMSLQQFRTLTRPLFSDQCLCISCGAIFVRLIIPSLLIASLTGAPSRYMIRSRVRKTQRFMGA